MANSAGCHESESKLVVLSLRGGDFELTVGRDRSIAYQSHTDKAVRLYLVETMAFRVLTPEAAVALAAQGRQELPEGLNGFAAGLPRDR